MSEYTEDPKRCWDVFTELSEQSERVRRYLLKHYAENGTSLELSSDELTNLWEARVDLERIADRLEAK